MGRVSTCKKNCKTIDLRGAQVKEMVIWDGCQHVKKNCKTIDLRGAQVNNNDDDKDNNGDDNHNNNDKNNNNDDASGCFFSNVTFTAVAESSIRGDFFSKAIINSLSLTCFSFISFYSELTSLYISTPYTYQVWI